MTDINSPSAASQVSDHVPNFEAMTVQELCGEKGRLEAELSELLDVLEKVSSIALASTFQILIDIFLERSYNGHFAIDIRWIPKKRH